jgi:tRNA(Ile2) C34 agmatinyltransferase TiaS
VRLELKKLFELTKTDKNVRRLFEDSAVSLAQKEYRYQLLRWASDLQVRGLSLKDAAEIFARVGVLALTEKGEAGKVCPRCGRELTSIDFAPGQTPAKGKCSQCHYRFSQSGGRVIDSEYV